MAKIFETSSLTVRPWGEFAEWGRFSIPDAQFRERSETNLGYYSGNYALIVGAVLLLTLFTNYNLLLAVLVLAGIGYYVFVVQPKTHVVGGFRVELLHQVAIFAIVSIIVVYKSSGLTLFYTTLFSLLVVLAHSLARKRNTNAKINNVVNKAKDFANIF
ncbi:PRA1 family protein 2 [Heterostelium album PN500]|uniref:PRA1 family protein n=1 Tax=Heterostelium pallidum (strain ATCC 26659 / Pp 5 / PN500) TaxID=670386 RepID=D3B3R8_HETP5|nr:PRA1 family protein 2 [Heterostelium album PN500]EFA83966.1 PRA1 family protein 2 [Heterostelium album PN500]|eukprot:XP_020436083.1 PRA1 family protein 2 [Heterostelium album PN500]